MYSRKHCHILLIALSVTMLLTSVAAAVAQDRIFDQLQVNGHTGYLTAWRVSGELDKPVVILKGYDTENDDHPIDDLTGDLAEHVTTVTGQGYDVIVFDYVNGEADLKQNADNLAEFIRHLNSELSANGVPDSDGDGHPDYPLAVIGGSMGGIVARTMLVQENQAMGVDVFVTLDSPHHGVTLKTPVEWAAEFLDSPAGHQMLVGNSKHDEHYDWLRSVESTPEFKAQVIGPIHTAAIALSDGESEWHLNFGDLRLNTKYHGVSSYVENSGVRVDYIPYHSAVNMDNISTLVVDEERWLYEDRVYVDTRSSYFDVKIPNPRTVHGAPGYAIQQAVDFVLAHDTEAEDDSSRWLVPILDLLLD